MKIACIGPGGSGKTTLVDYLVEHKIVDCKKLESVARQVFREYGWTESDQLDKPIQANWEVQKAIFERRQIAERHAGSCFISDRTLLDTFCYGLYRCASAIGDEEYRRLWKQTQLNLSTYDLLLLFPYYDNSRWTREDDKFRQMTNLAYGKTMEVLMFEFCEAMRSRTLLDGHPTKIVEFIKIQDVSVSERARMIERVVAAWDSRI